MEEISQELARELAVRCGRASGSDRDLNREIFATVQQGEFEDKEEARHYAQPDCPTNRADWNYLHSLGMPNYTESLDAAKKLVPEGWRIRMLDASVAGRFSWSLTGPLHGIEDPESPGLIVKIPQYASATGPCIVRALAAAALKARAGEGSV